MYEGREIFENAPLEYVAAEFRFPYAPRLRQPDVLDAIFLDVEDLFPILRPAQQLTITAGMAAGVPVGQPPQLDHVTRALSRRSDAAVTVAAGAITVDTTAYREYEDFRTIVARCLAAVTKHGRIAATERVGLRYINEVRIAAKVSDVRDWNGWLDDRVVQIAAMNSDLRAMAAEGAVQYAGDDHQSLLFRFAAVPEGQGVVGNAPLKRRTNPESGPFFVLDLDSYYQPPTEESPDWDVDSLLAMLDRLHAPIGVTFQAAITDRLRDEVLRGAK